MRNLILAVLAAVLVTGLGARTMLSQEQPLPDRIGFVDLSRVFVEYRKRQAIEDRLNLETDRLEQHYKRFRAEIEAGRVDLDVLNPGSATYQQKERELQQMAFLLKYDQERDMKGLERQARREKALLYREINDEAAAYGETNGYAAILLSVPVDEQLERRGDMDLVTSTRAVLWHDERLDVTNEIIQLLNAALPPETPKADPEENGGEKDDSSGDEPK